MKANSQIKKEYGRIIHMVENYVRYCRNIGMTGIHLGHNLQEDPPCSFSSLEELKSYLTQCRGCLVALNRQQAVPGEGNPKPTLVFVVGSPMAVEGSQSSKRSQNSEETQSSEEAQSSENAKRKPLQGKEGELFNKILSSIGLTREDIYLTCAVKCPLPEREGPGCQASQASHSGQSSPTSQTSRRCRRLLFQELQLLKPRIICTLDSLATQMVLGKPGSIDDLRGNIFSLQLGESQIKIIPTYSPGYILHYSEDESRCREIKKLVWQDMQQIRKEYDQARSCSST